MYISDEGIKEIRRVPDGSPTLSYEGVFVGPPDLFELPLEKKTIIALNNKLVEAGFITYEDLNGKRKAVLDLVQSLPDIKDPGFIRRELIRLYQRDYYPELFEDKK